ncbi:MAG: hypothetical protein A2234_08715 [Elusimicrobia bacterium RIFOXYA2_FULL_58_8]|nr:MAG: hypothetical protein A2285_05035 [Elusimicrobia bacterium RIFOXYA12_FULL_57_11]OGS16915.1 MAG: hypothetical protein A2234_08715 [Elusimicrobia bacterium RIFOXYA2_FULL_58_8]
MNEMKDYFDRHASRWDGYQRMEDATVINEILDRMLLTGADRVLISDKDFRGLYAEAGFADIVVENNKYFFSSGPGFNGPAGGLNACGMLGPLALFAPSA